MPRFVVSTDEDSMAAAAMSLDLVLNTVSANHDINHYLPLLVNNLVMARIITRLSSKVFSFERL